jgi:hypothetical protein
MNSADFLQFLVDFLNECGLTFYQRNYIAEKLKIDQDAVEDMLFNGYSKLYSELPAQEYNNVPATQE